MRKHSWLIVVLLLLLTACDEVQTGTPSPSGADDGAILSLPTRTLGPIVSFTPRFTATPIPSITMTPSDTPTPTLTSIPATATATTTLTPTPTVQGVIRSTENVNLRSGPGSNYEIVVSVPPGTPLGVLGIQVDSQRREWYKVAYADEDGEVQFLWIFANLVETDFKETVGLLATPPSTQPSTPARDVTGTVTPTPEPNRVEILAYCQQKNVRPDQPTTGDNVYIEWSWFVALPELMDQHLENANYEVRLDGELLDDWEPYATEVRVEAGVWIVYWFYPVGKLSAGEHTVEYRLTWDDAISDGYDQFGPGTSIESNQGNCTFNVVEP
ncbi:MAG: SH3 domain-containing protein [Chloroflexi bacterium]|nr:MAG: SH3 domain-containing protein [Chloroflexota bacterium]